MEFLINNPEALWVITVFYDLLLASLLFYFFGKEGLYLAIVLGIVLSNLQGGKVSDVVIFDRTFTVSMGAIMYSGIYFATDLLSEKYGRREANRAVILGALANIAVMLTLVLSTFFLPSDVADSADEVHNAISTLAVYSPIFVIGSITAYLISQLFDVWIFHKIKSITGTRMLWLRNNLSTLLSQALDTFIYTFVWILAGQLDFSTAAAIALSKYIFKFAIAILDTIFIYMLREIKPKNWLSAEN
ncbi:MAG: VUT family protein [SAR92 clade bacterium]|uniref:Probable queuosine precursor transporter n=1 Tax=SAR92 clade bacterium TaxID=2315479 RepID=A0A520LK31_9GAMM|nr:MAG: VUT family protein [SAR92 clade bacterium]